MFIESFRLKSTSICCRGRLVCRLRCDNCNKEFINRVPLKVVLSRTVHYCSRICKDTSDINRMRVKKANIKTYAEHRDEILAKIRSTIRANHGVDYALQLDRTIQASHTPQVETIRRASIKRVNASGLPARKRHETMKQNGTYGRSAPEDVCYLLLCEKFGNDHVKRQVELKNWSIDFYISSIDTYVQFDGAYWHGLDKSIELIEQSAAIGHRRDASILFTFRTDRTQNEWATANNIRLVRITDKEFKKNPMLLIERLS